MKARCFNASDKNFADYGGRGITVCNAWLDFDKFYDAMAPHPGEGWSLDRIDPDMGYSPENCRWAAPGTQQGNQRRTIRVTVNGTEVSLWRACKLLGLSYSTMWRRMAEGHSFDDLVSTF